MTTATTTTPPRSRSRSTGAIVAGAAAAAVALVIVVTNQSGSRSESPAAITDRPAVALSAQLGSADALERQLSGPTEVSPPEPRTHGSADAAERWALTPADPR